MIEGEERKWGKCYIIHVTTNQCQCFHCIWWRPTDTSSHLILMDRANSFVIPCLWWRKQLSFHSNKEWRQICCTELYVATAQKLLGASLCQAIISYIIIAKLTLPKQLLKLSFILMNADRDDIQNCSPLKGSYNWWLIYGSNYCNDGAGVSKVLQVSYKESFHTGKKFLFITRSEAY